MANPKVVIVDDEASLRELAKAVLSKNGFEVETVASAVEFLKKIENKELDPKNIDLILLDIMMPTMIGPELYKHIKKTPELKHIKVIFLTVVKRKELEPAYLKGLETVDFIQKPYKNDDLVERVKKACSTK